MTNLPPLNSLRAFEVTARLGNISKAAEELFLTHSAISRRISGLEDYMGADLFNRLPRGVELTYNGRQLYAVVSDLIGSLAFEVDKVRVNTESDMHLKVSLLPSFAARWLVPRFAKFDQLYPNIKVEMSTSLQMVDFENDKVDMAIRYGDGNYPGLDSTLFIEQSLYPVISPVHAERYKHIKTPADLLKENLLHDCNQADWPKWFQAAGCNDIKRVEGQVYDDYNVVLQAVMSGLGIALGRRPIIDFDLEAERLVPLFDTTINSVDKFYLVHPPQKQRNTAVAIFKEWLLKEAQTYKSGIPS